MEKKSLVIALLLPLLLAKRSYCETNISSPCGGLLKTYSSDGVFFLDPNNLFVALRQLDNTFGCVFVVNATTFTVKDSIKLKFPANDFGVPVVRALSEEVFVLCTSSYMLNLGDRGPLDVHCATGSSKSSSLSMKSLTKVNTPRADQESLTGMCVLSNSTVLVIYGLFHGNFNWDVYGFLITVHSPNTLAYSIGNIVRLTKNTRGRQHEPQVFKLVGQDAVLLCWTDDRVGRWLVGCSKLSHDTTVPRVIGDEMWAFGTSINHCYRSYSAHCGTNASFVVVAGVCGGSIALRVLNVAGPTPVGLGETRFINDILSYPRVFNGVTPDKSRVDLDEMEDKCVLSYTLKGSPTVAGFQELQVDAKGNLSFVTEFIAFQHTSVDTQAPLVAVSGSKGIVLLTENQNTVIGNIQFPSSTSSTTTSTYTTSSVTTTSTTTSSITGTTTTTSTSSSSTTSSTTTTDSTTTSATTITATSSSTTTSGTSTTTSISTSSTTSITPTTTSTISSITATTTESTTKDPQTTLTVIRKVPTQTLPNDKIDNAALIVVIFAGLVGVGLCSFIVFMFVSRKRAQDSTVFTQTNNPVFETQNKQDPNLELYVEPSVTGHVDV
eukprot:m.310692 g.310692  ORF g.310692 m.310692 type:complete len:607 (+) comp16478_c0_seq29:1203-3023(+)